MEVLPRAGHSEGEEALARPNLLRALRRVKKNKGSAGVDGMTVDDLSDWFSCSKIGERLKALLGDESRVCVA